MGIKDPIEERWIVDPGYLSNTTVFQKIKHIGNYTWRGTWSKQNEGEVLFFLSHFKKSVHFFLKSS